MILPQPCACRVLQFPGRDSYFSFIGIFFYLAELGGIDGENHHHLLPFFLLPLRWAFLDSMIWSRFYTVSCLWIAYSQLDQVYRYYFPEIGTEFTNRFYFLHENVCWLNQYFFDSIWRVDGLYGHLNASHAFVTIPNLVIVEFWCLNLLVFTPPSNCLNT